MKKESLIHKILRWLGIIKEIKVTKKEMCKQAQSICNHECESCGWAERKE